MCHFASDALYRFICLRFSEHTDQTFEPVIFLVPNCSSKYWVEIIHFCCPDDIIILHSHELILLWNMSVNRWFQFCCKFYYSFHLDCLVLILLCCMLHYSIHYHHSKFIEKFAKFFYNFTKIPSPPTLKFMATHIDFEN